MKEEVVVMVLVMVADVDWHGQSQTMDLSNVQCFHHHQYGHYASGCPVLNDNIA